MTFSVSRDRGAFEWAGDTVFTVFCQRTNLWRAAHWRMIWDIVRFNACAQRLVGHGEAMLGRGGKEMSIGEYLVREGYSDSFRDDYLIVSSGALLRNLFSCQCLSYHSNPILFSKILTQPMTAAIWSTPPDACALDFPARTLLRFMHNHHLLQLTGKPSWLTIAPSSASESTPTPREPASVQRVKAPSEPFDRTYNLTNSTPQTSTTLGYSGIATMSSGQRGGSHAYVRRILSRLPASQTHFSSPVTSVRSARSPGTGEASGVLLTVGGKDVYFDEVILATHSDTTLKILEGGGETTEEERSILGAFEWTRNEAVLHCDTAVSVVFSPMAYFFVAGLLLTLGRS